MEEKKDKVVVVKFRAKPTKSGPRYYFNIPINYIRNGLIDPDEEYIIYPVPRKHKKT